MNRNTLLLLTPVVTGLALLGVVASAVLGPGGPPPAMPAVGASAEHDNSPGGSAKQDAVTAAAASVEPATTGVNESHELIEAEPIAERLAPEDAVKLGLAGLVHLYPAGTPAQSEILNHCRVGAWGHAVNAFRGWTTGLASGDISDPEIDLALYLLQLRAAGLFIETQDDELLASLLTQLRNTFGAEGGPLYRAGLFAEGRDVIMEALWGLTTLAPDADPPVLARLEALAQISNDDELAWLAQQVINWLRGEGDRPREELEILGSNGFVYRRARGSGSGRATESLEVTVDPAAFSLADLPRLRQLFATGSEQDRANVAVVIGYHRWPQAFDLAEQMANDPHSGIRRISYDVFLDWDTAAAIAVLIQRFPNETFHDLRYTIVAGVFMSDASPSGRDEMFTLAIRANSASIRGEALDAMEGGRLTSLQVATDSLVDCYFRHDGPPGEVQRAMRWIWNERPSEMTLAIGEAVRNASEQHLAAIATLLADHEFDDRTDAEVVSLLAMTLDRDSEELVRLAAVNSLVSRFGPEAVNVLEACVLPGRSDAVCRMLESFTGMPRMELPAAHRLVKLAAQRRDPQIEEVVLDVIRSDGDARYLDVLVLLQESALPAHRSRAATTAVPLGDCRHVLDLSVLLADPDGSVVLDAMASARKLLRVLPTSADEWVRSEVNIGLRVESRCRRIADRPALWSALLGRLAGGDYDVVVWLHAAFPRVKMPPLEQMTAEEFAARYAAYLRVPIGPTVHPPASISQRKIADQCAVSTLFWQQVLNPALRRAGVQDIPEQFRAADDGVDAGAKQE